MAEHLAAGFRDHPHTRPPYGLPPLAPYVDPLSPTPETWEWAAFHPAPLDLRPPVEPGPRRPVAVVVAAWLQLGYLLALAAFVLMVSLPNSWAPAFFCTLIGIGSTVLALPWLRPGWTTLTIATCWATIWSVLTPPLGLPVVLLLNRGESSRYFLRAGAHADHGPTAK